MANYSVTTTTSEDAKQSVVQAALEAAIEATDTTKVIRHYSIVYNKQRGVFVGTVVVDT